MTNDSDMFTPRPEWEAKAYKPDPYGRWIGPENDIGLPLYEGRMIGQFDFSEKGWISGKGRTALWKDIPWEKKLIEPQYCMRGIDYTSAVDRDGNPKAIRGNKIAFMDVTSATNMRTMIASAVADFPCGNSAPVLTTQGSPQILLAILNSFTYDFIARARCGGLHLNYFVIEETPLIPLENMDNSIFLQASALAIPAISFAADWLRIRASRLSKRVLKPWKYYWAITEHERLRIRCIIDAIIAELYGLDLAELQWILKECDYAPESLRDKNFCRTLDLKGFWRVDKEKDPELRHTVLSLVAFKDLKQLMWEVGDDRETAIRAFCTMDDGDGWQLPEGLCLADVGLGHDERAKKPQPVRERLGPRFLPWQVEESVEESWAECEMHARNMLGEEGFARLEAELKGEMPAKPSLASSVAEAAEPYMKAGEQGKLF